MIAKLAYSLCQGHRLGMGPRAIALVATVAIAGCRPAAPPPSGITPSPTPPRATPTSPTTATQPSPTATLPNSLVQTWEPMSNVLLAFGPMTITPNQVQWGSGQTSPYTLVGIEGGYLLRLEANPSFYDTPNPYIKLIPKADPTGAASSIEVAFYTDNTQVQNDEYIMYGSYFAN
jgi:hypothetical protein